jgi:hypothetical protein
MTRHNLITLPGNPIWKVFKSFGADEFISIIINFIATAFLTYLLSKPVGEHFLILLGIQATILLSVVGPVIEKIGFFPLHFYEALKEYRSTDIKERKKLRFYLSKAMKDGSGSLVKDILVHDPIYIFLMYFILIAFPGTPPWVVCVFSFLVAVFAVACLEVGCKEIIYYLIKLGLKKKGFDIEQYFEARFYYDNEDSARSVLNALVEKYGLGSVEDDGSFTLGKISTLDYNDAYFEEKDGLNGRKAQVRLRDRKHYNGRMRSWQFIYLLVSEVWNKEVDQFRYFVSKKEKIYYQGDIALNEKARKEIQKRTKTGEKSKISFNREVAQHPDNILVSFDCVPKKNAFIVEIKARPDRKNILVEAMKHAMNRGGKQTTYGKYHL